MRRSLHTSPLLLLAAVLLCLLLCAGRAAADSTDVAHGGPREVRIAFWEQEVRKLRQTELRKAQSDLYAAQAALEQARRREGFFYTDPKDKATIKLLDEDFQRALVEMRTVRDQENMMLSKLKPLYGVVSRQFVAEQKSTIAEAIQTVQEMSYNNAWWSSLFNLNRAESFTDAVLGFFIEWLIGYVVMYPFAILYYGLWAAPRSVWSYCSGLKDLVPALLMYVASVTVMALPMVFLVGGVYLVVRKNLPYIRASMEEAQRRHRYHQD